MGDIIQAVAVRLGPGVHLLFEELSHRGQAQPGFEVALEVNPLRDLSHSSWLSLTSGRFLFSSDEVQRPGVEPQPTVFRVSSNRQPGVKRKASTGLPKGKALDMVVVQAQV